MAQPRLTFFCELETEPLQALFADPAVVNDLVALGAGVSLGILDLSPERADVVRQLNAAGVPVVAWQLLPKDQGYWFNLGNAPQAAARYADFRAWTAGHGLRWDGVGLDVEPDIREMQQAMEGRWTCLLPSLLRRVPDTGRLRRARATYGALIDCVRSDGYRVDSYQFPFIVDERRAGSTLLQRLTGVLDLPAGREVLMLYTSFFRPHGPALLWSYGRAAQSIGVGNAGGGVQMEGVQEPAYLDWDEFARDLRLAARRTDDVHVFSLEGCQRQGFLARLHGFDWDAPVELPLRAARRVDAVRGTLRALLWASAHPLPVLGGLIGLAWLLSRLRRRR